MLSSTYVGTRLLFAPAAPMAYHCVENLVDMHNVHSLHHGNDPSTILYRDQNDILNQIRD